MKKWTFLLAAGLLAGATPVFTGCIDNDEPEGISILRGAKAELLKAKAAVEEANAAFVMAQAEYEKAKALVEKANAEYRQAEVEKVKLQNELLAAQNEAEKEILKAKVEKAKQDMEAAAQQHLITMETLKGQLAVAQRNFEIIQKQIEIAKQLGSEKDQVSIMSLEVQLYNVKAVLFGGQQYYIVNGAMQAGAIVKPSDSISERLYQAKKKVYNAQMNAAAGYDTDEYGNKSEKPILWAEALQVEVDKAEADLKAKEEEVKRLQKVLDADEENTDWKAEISKLEKEIQDLENQISEKNVEIEKSLNTPEYIAAWQKVYGVFGEDADVTIGKPSNSAAVDGKTPVQKGTFQKLADAQDDVEAEQGNALTVKATEAVKTTETVLALTDLTADELKSNKVDYNYENIRFEKLRTELPTQVKAEQDRIKEVIKKVQKGVSDANDVAQAELIKKQYEKVLKEKLQPAHKAALEDWNIAVLAKTETATPVPTTEYEKTTAAYNKLYVNLAAAVKTYNSTYDDQLKKNTTAKFNELMKADEDGLRKEVFTKCAAPAAPAQYWAGVFDAAAAQAAWGKLAAEFQNVENFKIVIKNASKAYNDTQDPKKNLTADQVAEKALAYYNDYLKKETDKQIKVNEKIAAEHALANIESDKAVVAKAKAITEANEAVTKFIQDAKLTQAYEKFGELAAIPYGQKLTYDATKTGEVLARLIGTADKKGKYTVAADYVQNELKEDKPTGHKVVAINDITADDIKAVTAAKLDAEKAEAALQFTSKAAFGMDGEDVRYVAPKEADIREYAESTGTPLAQVGTWGAVLAQEDKIEAQSNIITAGDDLKALQTAMEKVLADFDAAVKANFEANFGDTFAAYDAAAKAHGEATAALNKAYEPFKDLEVDLAKLETSKVASQSVLEAVRSAVDEFLGINSDEKADYVAFEKALAAAILDAKADLAEKNRLFEEAKANLDKAKNEEFNGVAYFQAQLKHVEAEYEEASKRYEKATKDLEKALAIMAAKAE